MMNFDTRFGRALMEQKIAEATREAGVSDDDRADQLRRKVGLWLITIGQRLMARGERLVSTDPKTI